MTRSDHPAPTLSAARLAALLEQPPPTAEQTAVIEAPLRPLLVVAGAGSGKTETMASRVVWLIANAVVEPRQVLGLTFTRKAAHELSARIAQRLATLAGALRAEGLPLPPGLERGGDELVGQRPAVHTYNGFALDLVREHALAVGIDAELTMMSTSASWQLAHSLVESSGDDLEVDASPATLTAALLSLTSSLADHLVTPAQLRAHLEAVRDHLAGIPLQVEGRRRTTPKDVAKVIGQLEQRLALIPLLERFTAIRAESSALDFADQVSLAARIAREVPAAGALARRLHRVVLLDEFQDTSVAQLRMLTDLFGPGHAACAVGDPQQAIYGWRGASAASLAGFAEAFATPEQPVLQRTLSTSWRNDEAVLAIANRLAGPLRAAGAGIEIPELHPRPGAGEGAVEIHEAADEASEARAIGRWILARRAEAPEDETPSAAVLVRARRQIRALVEGLEAEGLPVHVVGLGGLLHRPEVADVRALLEAAHDPGRGDALMRLLTGPRVRLGARDLAVLGRWRDRLGSRLRAARPATADGTPQAPDEVEEISLLDAVDDLPPRDWADPSGRSLSDTGRERLEQVQRVLREMRRLLPLPLPDLVTAAVRLLEVDLALREDDPSTRALADLEALREHAAAFDRTARRGGLAAYLDLLEISEDEEAALSVGGAGEAEAVDDPEAVTIVTMHSAKGLEWDLVAVAGLTEGSVPSYDLRRAKADESGRLRVPGDGWLGPLAGASVPTALRGDADTLPELAWAEADTQVDAEALIAEYRFAQGEEQLREDRRLMYVAVTRARRRLLLASAAWRLGLTSARPRSRYLTESEPLVPERFRRRDEVPAQNPLESVRPTASWPPTPGERERARDRAAEQLAAAEDLPPADPELAETLRRVLDDLARQAAPPAVHSPPRLSASQVVQQARDPRGAALDLVRPLPRRPSAAAARGTAFHAWLEHRFGGAALLDLEDLPDLGEDEAPQLDDLALREAFSGSAWAGRTPLAVERPVHTRVGDIAVRGVIDAVFPDPDAPDGDGVIIVDWKTGRMPRPAQLRERSLQLSLYRLAWHEETGLPLSRIRTAFHFVAEGVTHEVRRHPSRARIIEMLLGE